MPNDMRSSSVAERQVGTAPVLLRGVLGQPLPPCAGTETIAIVGVARHLFGRSR
jgi:hypothetical protein